MSQIDRRRVLKSLAGVLPSPRLHIQLEAWPAPLGRRMFPKRPNRLSGCSQGGHIPDYPRPAIDFWRMPGCRPDAA
jgi:hypothetical protein